MPFTLSFWLVESEAALKVGSVGITPLSLHEVSILESANVLFARQFKDVGALTVFLSIGPVTGVDVLIFVSHNAFTMTLTILPVAIIFTDILVLLLADA